MDNRKLKRIEPNDDWVIIKTIDMHTGGEPVHVILEGYPLLKEATVLDHRNYFKSDQRGFGDDAFHSMWYLLFFYI